MRRTNRIEPSNIDPKYLTCAFMITTTQLEIVRRVEITPITESVTDHVRSPIERSDISTPFKPSRKILWCIGCLFFAAGMLALLIMITGLAVIFRRVNMMRKSNIERYDLGDLQYGISNVYYPPNTYLSDANKAAIQKYLSEQLRNEPGFRGLVIDDVYVQEKSIQNQRKQRGTSCSILFIIQNTQVYFDHCPTCTNNRNVILHRLFFNRTAFRERFHLFGQICSTPNKSQLIIPQQVDISEFQRINFTSTSSILSHEITTTAFTEPTSTRKSEQSTTLTSRDSIRTHETSSRKMTLDQFQFLPFRPSTRKFRR